MTRRRALFAFVVPLMDESPKNQLAAVANKFHEQYVKWATAFNRVKPDTLDAAENEAFLPLMEMWRKVERLRGDWIRGI
jgi:hypothetical protein